MQGKHVEESPGGGGKPQEIDGEDGGNPSLCRNRVVPPMVSTQSECQPGDSP